MFTSLRLCLHLRPLRISSRAPPIPLGVTLANQRLELGGRRGVHTRGRVGGGSLSAKAERT